MGHHFVQKEILKNFADSEGLLWVHRKSWGRSEIKHLPPKNVFQESGLNTLKQDLVINDDLVFRKGDWPEKKISYIESQANPIIRGIIESFQTGGVDNKTLKKLTLHEKRILKSYIILSVIRLIPIHHKNLKGDERAVTPIVQYLKWAKDPDESESDIKITYISDPNKSFIISDGFFDQLHPDRLYVHMPIHPKIEVAVIDHPIPREFTVHIDIPKNHGMTWLIRQMNLNWYKFSTTIASQSKALIESIVKNR